MDVTTVMNLAAQLNKAQSPQAVQKLVEELEQAAAHKPAPHGAAKAGAGHPMMQQLQSMMGDLGKLGGGKGGGTVGLPKDAGDGQAAKADAGAKDSQAADEPKAGSDAGTDAGNNADNGADAGNHADAGNDAGGGNAGGSDVAGGDA